MYFVNSAETQRSASENVNAEFWARVDNCRQMLFLFVNEIKQKIRLFVNKYRTFGVLLAVQFIE